MGDTPTLIESIEGSRDWTLKLIADLSGDDWFFQPSDDLQHALWICGHLASSYQTLILMRCLGRDNAHAEFVSHFPLGGSVKSASVHDYPSPDAVIARMAVIHDETVDGIRGMSDDQLAEPCYGKDGVVHPHYTTKRGAILHCARHEAFHAGQIALLRRLMGKAFLR